MGKLITITETAKRFGIAERTVHYWVEKGYILVKTKGRSSLVDEDTVLALQDTVEDIKRQQEAIERLRDDLHRVHERYTDERREGRYNTIIVHSGLRSGFWDTMVRLMVFCGSISEREGAILSEYLGGEYLEVIAKKYNVSRERIRQTVARAIRKSSDLTNIENELSELGNLRAENEILKKTLAQYQSDEAESKAQNTEMGKMLSTKIVDCDLSIRAINCLWIGRVEKKFSFDKTPLEKVIVPPCRTIGDICRLKRSDYMQIRNAGKKSAQEIEDFLHSHGLDWGMDVDKIYRECAKQIV